MSDAIDSPHVGHVIEMSPTGPRLGSPMLHALPVVEPPTVVDPPALLRIPETFHSVDAALACAGKLGLTNCVVVSEKEDGSLVLLDSGLNVGEINWILNRLRVLILAPGQGARP